MANKTISELTEKTSPVGNSDYFVIVDNVGNPVTKKITFKSLFEDVRDNNGNPFFGMDLENKIFRVGDSYNPVINFDPGIDFYVVGTRDGYYGMNVTNLSDGTTASSDIVAVSGTVGAGLAGDFADFGINGQNWADSAYAVFDAKAGYIYNNQNNFYVGTGGSSSTTGNLYFFTGGYNSKDYIRGQIDYLGNFVIGKSSLGTNVTDGFLYIPSMAGAPSNTPTDYTGRVPMVYDSTNNQFYIYNGAWKKVLLS